MGRVRMGWQLAKRSGSTLAGDRSLAVFPLLSAIAVVALASAFWLPAAFLFDDGVGWAGVVLVAIGVYLVTFVGVFFNVALASCASRALDGEDTRVGDGLAAAGRRVGPIAGWAAIAASVSIVLRAIEQRLGPLGAVLSGVAGLAWALVTFLATPVIALEGLGPLATLKRSGAIFRARWGEQVTGQVSIGLVVGLIGVLPGVIIGAVGLALISGGSAVGGGVLLGLGILIAVVAAVIGNALTQIFAVALYRYATTGASAGPFTAEELAGAVVPRRPGGPRPRAGEI